MSITFGGLASGLDTESIISSLMKIERAPIDRLQREQAYYRSRLNAFSTLDNRLKSFLTKAQAVDTSDKFSSTEIKTSSNQFLSVTGRADAGVGNYQMTVNALAQQQKDVFAGYASKDETDFGTGNLTLTVGGEAHSIAITSENNSLEGLARAINDANLGVGAAIINDGTDSPYRLVLTGTDTSQTFDLDDSGLVDGSAASLFMVHRQVAQDAEVEIDGIIVKSSSNTIDNAIPGLSLELLKADQAQKTVVDVVTTTNTASSKIKDFVTGYNDIVKFIDSQKSSGWGNDLALRSIKSQLQGFLVKQQGDGALSSLAQLGFETQRDGTIKINETILSKALDENFDDVVNLFAGKSGFEGVAKDMSTYIKNITDPSNGFYAVRKKTTDTSVRTIDQRITSLEARLEQKETNLRAQYSAMEQLISGLNAQGGYLMQQLSNMPTIGGNRK